MPPLGRCPRRRLLHGRRLPVAGLMGARYRFVIRECFLPPGKGRLTGFLETVKGTVVTAVLKILFTDGVGDLTDFFSGLGNVTLSEHFGEVGPGGLARFSMTNSSRLRSLLLGAARSSVRNICESSLPKRSSNMLGCEVPPTAGLTLTLLLFEEPDRRASPFSLTVEETWVCSVVPLMPLFPRFHVSQR